MNDDPGKPGDSALGLSHPTPGRRTVKVYCYAATLRNINRMSAAPTVRFGSDESRRTWLPSEIALPD